MSCCGNCKDNKPCESSLKHFKQNVDMKHVRNETHEGKQYMVVPVVMMVAGAHYNGGLVTEEEFLPQTWNGRPVTIGHPEKGGQHMSANDPEMESQFTVGKLYNAKIEDGKLKAEAWIDITKCNSLGRSDVVKMLKDKSAELDVSTGYYCDSFEQNGEHNGKEYTEIHRNLKPDHLALLPDEEGACNFADGCGVRANKMQGGLAMKINEAFEVLAQHFKKQSNDKMEVNMDEEQKAELIAELVAAEASPFSNEDKAALEAMSEDTLKKMMDGYKKPEQNAEEDDEPEANGEGGDDAKANSSALSDEDKAALEFARNQYREHKKNLVSKITANSTMREKQLADMSVAQLEVIANGLAPAQPDYSGRGFATQSRGNDNSKTKMIKAMKVQSLSDLVKAKNGGNA